MDKGNVLTIRLLLCFGNKRTGPVVVSGLMGRTCNGWSPCLISVVPRNEAHPLFYPTNIADTRLAAN